MIMNDTGQVSVHWVDLRGIRTDIGIESACSRVL